jgi:hypothetical protein
MTPDDLFADFRAGFSARNYSAGLLVALIDMIVSLGVPGSGIGSFDELLVRYPRRLKTAQGRPANTLILETSGGKTVSIRGFYDAVERYFHADQKRFGYPSMAPHATQAWPDYPHWFDALVTFDAEQLAGLRARVVQLVLDTFESQEFDPTTVVVEPPLFKMLLEEFDLAPRKGEPTGAAFQGMVFGFLRADNPHLQIEIGKVRTGSKRLQRIGDIDGWEGARLAISAEVKQYDIGHGTLTDLSGFANEIGRRGALGVLAALGFQESVREAAVASGLIPLDRTDMLRIVELWDPIKQRTAVASFGYYASHVEKNVMLTGRLSEFLARQSSEWAERHEAIRSDVEVEAPPPPVPDTAD